VSRTQEQLAQPSPAVHRRMKAVQSHRAGWLRVLLALLAVAAMSASCAPSGTTPVPKTNAPAFASSGAPIETNACIKLDCRRVSIASPNLGDPVATRACDQPAAATSGWTDGPHGNASARRSSPHCRWSGWSQHPGFGDHLRPGERQARFHTGSMSTPRRNATATLLPAARSWWPAATMARVS